MKLNDKYSIVKDSDGFALIEKTMVEITKDRKKTGKFKEGSRKLFYGTVYQALQGFLRVSVDDTIESNTDILEEVGKVLYVIDEANKIIKAGFCIEVMTIRPESNTAVKRIVKK